jgi:hypothetical protein
MSATLKVEFIGICTRIAASYVWPVSPPPGVSHRIVLVNASQGAMINGAPIPPHEALIEIDPASIKSMGAPSGLLQRRRGVWELRGVQLWIPGARTPESEPAPMPNLGLPSMLTQAHGDLPALDQNVVTGGRAAAYFDITGGLYRTTSFGEAATGTLFVETPGDPTLRIRTSWDESETTIELYPASKIILKNVGSFDDSTNDFFLHYGVCVAIPPDITPPGPAKGPDLNGLTAGCSNSNYP